jgi:hypothetical protein
MKMTNDNSNYTDSFGFLNYKINIEFDGGKILPIDEYDEYLDHVNKYVYEDGCIYEPMTVKEIKPNAEKPALMYSLPASHKIILHEKGTQKEIRMRNAGFIIHLLSYIFGTRLQFYGWWFDGKIPISKLTHHIYFDHLTLEDFILACYSNWKSYSEEQYVGQEIKCYSTLGK